MYFSFCPLQRGQPRQTRNFASPRDKEKTLKSLDLRVLLDFASMFGGMDGIAEIWRKTRTDRRNILYVSKLYCAAFSVSWFGYELVTKLCRKLPQHLLSWL